MLEENDAILADEGDVFASYGLVKPDTSFLHHQKMILRAKPVVHQGAAETHQWFCTSGQLLPAPGLQA